MSLPLCGDCPDAFRNIAAEAKIQLDSLRTTVLQHNSWEATMSLDTYRELVEFLQKVSRT